MRFHETLDEILGNPSAVRLVRILALFPAKEWTGRELAKASGVAAPSANRELGRLKTHGIVVGRTVGRANLWRVRRSHHVWSYLIELYAKERGTPGVLDETILAHLRAIPGLTRVILFGSVGRRQEAPDSDVDVCVVLEDASSRPAVPKRLDALRIAIQDTFGNHLSPVVLTEREMRRKFRRRLVENIEKDGRVIFPRPNADGKD